MIPSLLISAPNAARYLGVKRNTLVHAAGGTLCLNEFRRRAGRSIFYIAAQVEAHGARIVLYGKCDGRCRKVAERVIKEARETIFTAEGRAA